MLERAEEKGIMFIVALFDGAIYFTFYDGTERYVDTVWMKIDG
jgi:hypothetical protein